MHVSRIARQVAVFTLALLVPALGAHATTTGVESVLASLPSAQQPSQLIQASNGNFYGTVPTGGANSKGYIFSITPGGVLSTVYSFTGVADGGTPNGSLIEGNDGNLYGTDTTGGSGSGVLFQVTFGGAITVLHTFTAATDGSLAGSLIETTAGDFYGAAQTGGASSSGTVFEYSHLGVFSLVHTFTGSGGDGFRPNPPLLLASDGLIYGATVRGGADGAGSLFNFDPANIASFATFGSFPPTNQSDPAYNPTFGMTEGTDGALYGLTSEGGSGYGSVYKVVPGSSPAVTLDYYDFVSFNDGGLPFSSLTLGGDGNFYGTTSSYGPGGPPNGTIFQFLPGGSPSLNALYGFSGPVSGNAIGAPIQGADGNFYGSSFAQVYKLVATPAVPAPVVLTASSASITFGSGVTLGWQVNNAFSETMQNCQAQGSWTGSLGLTGSQIVTPPAVGTYNYALTCGGVESAFVTVTVTPSANATLTPVITPNGGNYNGPVAYNITDASPGAVIYYTTNGAMPTTASPVWAGVPVVLTGSATVQAIAVASPLTASGVATANFVIAINTKSCVVNYAGGFNPSTGLLLNHGATVVGPALELTHGLQNERTSAFTNKDITLGTFATAFTFRFENATPTSADGMAFVLEAGSPLIYGLGAGGLGYAGIPHSMALKFDLHNNAGEGDNSVGLYFDGVTPTTPSITLNPSGINLHSGHIMLAYVTYDSQFVQLELSDTVTGKHFSHSFHLPAVNPIGSSLVHVGFTASTDALTSHAQVLRWLLEDSGPCVLR